MSTRTAICAVCLAALAAAVPSPVHARWIEGGTAVCTAANDQNSHVIVSDGSGGAFMAWRDDRTTWHVYVQHVDAYGYPQWDPGGVRVTDLIYLEYNPALVPDGDGGVIVAFSRSGPSWDIYAQRLDSGGTALWGSSGVVVSASSGVETEPVACTDMAGGAIIAWTDYVDGDYDVFAQRIDAAGAVQWGSSGIALCTVANNQQSPDIAPDGMGGAYVCWTDFRVDSDIYVNRVLPDGTPVNAGSGIAVCTSSGVQNHQEMIPDGAGGALLTWQDTRSGYYDIYAQRIYFDCTSLWAADGVAVCVETSHQRFPRIASDKEWGAIIAWEDGRGSYSNIYAQRISAGGNGLWAANGTDICPGSWTQTGVDIYPDGDGGAIVVWEDFRNYIDSDIFAQRIDENGQDLWAADGEPLSTSVWMQVEPILASDGMGGALACWLDYRSSYDYSDVYAQRVERNGYWGYPSPEIVSVRDVPGDQGGYVSLSWDASRLNVWPEDAIGRYEIWRALDGEAATMMLENGTAEIRDHPERPVPADGPNSADGPADREILRKDLMLGEPYYWHLAATVDAVRYREHYSEIVETLFDSTDVSNEYHYWQVVAWDIGYNDYWYSQPDSGYSTDDLAPAAPLGLAGEQMYLPDGLQLTWDPNFEPDLAEYRVYRGTSEGFEPGPGNFVASTPDTASFDGDWDWAAGYWYKVSAVDEHGNESVFAVLGPDLVTGDDPMPAPERTFLAQNYPNPFNPATTIAFGLKESRHVSLRIYDAAGRLVRTLASGTMDRGTYEIPWNGTDDSGADVSSGVYFYMLRTEVFERTRKMVLLR